MLEVSRLALCVLRQTRGDVTLVVVDGDITGITRSWTDSVQWAAAAVVLAVLVTVLAHIVVVRVFFHRTLGLTVRTVLDMLAANTRPSRLAHMHRIRSSTNASVSTYLQQRTIVIVIVIHNNNGVA